MGNHAAKCLCNASHQYNVFLGTITPGVVLLPVTSQDAAVFRDDSFALEVGKQRIRTEFLKHKIETDQAKIAELIQMVEGAEKVPRCNIVQGIQTDNGTFRLRITKDTELQNNVFDESNLA